MRVSVTTPSVMQFPSSGVRRVFSSSSQSSKPPLAGTLVQKDATGKVIAKKSVHTNKELVIGRDRSKCQWTIDDPQISRKHLRIYSVVYDADDPSEVDILVYAQDLSQNGTFWNGSFIGKGNGGFLLSQDDCLKLSQNVLLCFQSHRNLDNVSHFDLVQEREMKDFAGSYLVTDRLLGSGAFGRVFMAIEKKSRSQLACKVVDLRQLRPHNFIGRKEEPSAAEDVDDRVQLHKVRHWAEKKKQSNQFEGKLKLYFREVEILASISHPNIIGLEKVFITDNTLYMFQDLVTAGDLFSYIESKNGKLLEVEAAVVIRQILTALCFLHKNNIVHRDLKPDNILMTSLSAGCRVVLTDFGAARRIKYPSSRMSSMAGTDEYAAPEIFCQNRRSGQHLGYTKAVDLWSLGCVAVVLLTGGSAFNDPKTNNYSKQLAEECDLEFLRKSPEWQEVRPRPAAFVEQLLVLNEDQRLTAPEALQHKWFSNQIHKTNFQELYERTVKHWRPRPAQNNLIEFQDAWNVQAMDALQPLMPERRSRKARNDPMPQDAHLKPFPRKVFLSLQPPRRFRNILASPEVQSAIEEYWTDLSSDVENERGPKVRSQVAEKADRHTTVIGPNSAGSKDTPCRSETLSTSPRKISSLSRRNSFRHTSGSVRAGPRTTTDRDGFAENPAYLNLLTSPPPLISSYFEAAVTLRPASPREPRARRPWSSAARTNILRDSDADADGKQSDPGPNNNQVDANADTCHKDDESDALNDKSATTTPVSRHKLRRLSYTSSTGSDVPRKRRRGSIFEIDEDPDSDVDVDTRDSPCAAKRQKHILSQPDTPSDSNRDATEGGEQEVTLPHHIVTFSRSGRDSVQDLYLPR